jgi:hypothetical protein
MSGLSDFIGGLKDTEWDILMAVMNDLSDSTSQERLESLRLFLRTITREIDAVNHKRDALGHRRDNADALINIIDSRLRQKSDINLLFFKNVLTNWKTSLQTEISETRPNLKLEKKYDTERKRDLLIELQPIVVQLGDAVSNLKRPALIAPPAPAKPSDKTLGITPSDRSKLDQIIDSEGSKVK